MYTNEEKNDMLFCYYASNRNSNEASEMYLQRYMERKQPDKRLFSKLENNLKQYGSFMKPNDEKQKFKQEDEERVLAYVNYKPTTSTREIASECAISAEKARLILKQNKFKPFKSHIGNTLYPADSERRLHYARWFLRETGNNPNFSRGILFTDEAKFTNNGIFNRRNHIYWSENNPHLTVERRDQHIFSVNVWCGILSNRIIGPFFYDSNLNGERYLQFLQNDLEDMLDELPLNLLQNFTHFQHDGAPAHNSRAVSEYLSERFPSWIGNAGPVSWPARTPDMTPLDFFLWGAVKDKVYKERPNNVEELKNRITLVIRRIRPDSLEKVHREMVRRCQMCVQVNGGHFEHLI